MKFSLRELILAVVAAGALVGYKVDHWYMGNQLDEAQKKIELLQFNNQSVIIGRSGSTSSSLLPSNGTIPLTGWGVQYTTTSNGNVYFGEHQNE